MPDCSTCGYVVDYARSCHHGTWRLFRDSDVETSGRFYFAPPDTPHYPGWHNLWNGDWTYEREEAYTPPALGEDRSKRTGYSKGNLGVAHPAAIALGSGDCIESGEVYPPQADPVERQLVNGIDAACWQGNPPDPAPVLWLLPEGLDSLADFDPIARWKDESVYGNDAVQADPDLRPVKGNDGLSSYAEFTFPQLLDLLRPVVLRYNFTMFAVFSDLFWSGAGVVNTTVLSGTLRVTPTQWRHPPPGSAFVRNWAGPGALPGLVAFRRRGESVTLNRNAVDEETFAVVAQPFTSQLAVNVVSQAPFGVPSGRVREVKLYQSGISDSLWSSELAYFQAKYGF